MAYLDNAQLLSLGFARLGTDVKISDRCSVHNPNKISLGDHVRIDDFSVISAGAGGIVIGNYVHIATQSTIIGHAAITFHDFVGLSARVSIWSSSDDYGGEYLTNPTVPEKYKNTKHAPVVLGKHVIVGTGAVILPGVTIGSYSAIGALSLVTKNCSEGMIYSGIPSRPIKPRRLGLIELEGQLLRDTGDHAMPPV